MMKGNWRLGLVLIGAIVLATIVSQNTIANRANAWAVALVLVAALVAVVGLTVSGRLDGALIDNRNRVSFSKLQAVAWTIVVSSAIITETARRLLGVGSVGTSAVEFTIPGNLLIVMGLAATSLVATPMLLSLKATPPDDGSDDPKPDAKSGSQVFSRAASEAASWGDIFTGDDVGNAQNVDLSKVQQFIITALLIGTYCATLWNFFGATDPGALPDFGSNFVWLLGISHAGYLTYKAAPHGGAPAESASSTAPQPGHG